ncbi:hypothetical protein OEZ86_001138 [Tetradesmus obliquus]|nr:hypothetical protein OEZ86_001138 [Tetradesmus obliquus]
MIQRDAGRCRWERNCDQLVDVVYLWVNGSDPLHQATLRQYAPNKDVYPGYPHILESSSSQARFSADRDELRFSLRSLAQHMPWFRHLYIVTNGQVPAWLDVTHPRVTVVPHASIFPNPQHLPTFNSHAIEAHLHRIPRLAERFVAMNDDFFFTGPWSLADFVREDGSEVMYMGEPVRTCRPGISNCAKPESLFGASLQHVDRLFTNFSEQQRYTPMHSPYFINKTTMQRLQAEFPEEYVATSANRFRTGTDMQFAAAYKWYAAHLWGSDHPSNQQQQQQQDEVRSGSQEIANADENHAAKAPHNVMLQQQQQQQQQQQGEVRANTADEDAAKAVHFVMLQDRMAWEGCYRQLDEAWRQPGVRFVCLNDNTYDANSLTEITAQTLQFLNAVYPKPSEFELPEGVTNGCQYVTASFGSLPSAEDVAAACIAAQ